MCCHAAIAAATSRATCNTKCFTRVLLLLAYVCSLRKAVEYWKEQAGLLTTDAKVAADLLDIENRRCDSPLAGADGGHHFSTPPAASLSSTTSSMQGSRPGTALSRMVGSAVALQLQAAAADAPAPMAEPLDVDAGTDAGSLAGEQDSVALPSSRSTGSESEL